LQVERKQKNPQDNMQTILNFLKLNYKTIGKIAFGIFILYYLIFFLTPRVQMSLGEKTKIDSLNKMMKELIKEQNKLDSTIILYNKEINDLDKNISSIKGQKTIIKEIYHDEINRVVNYNDAQLDSFFTNRYK